MKRRDFLKSLLALGGVPLVGLRPKEESLPVVELSKPVQPVQDDQWAPYHLPVGWTTRVIQDEDGVHVLRLVPDEKPGWLL